MRYLYFPTLLILIQCASIRGQAEVISAANLNRTLATNEFVLLHFAVDWCPYSTALVPIFNEAATELRTLYSTPGKVLLGHVDCQVEKDIAKRFHVMKYPTLKVVRNGQLCKREYRGQRKVQAIVEFVRNQTACRVVQLNTTEDWQLLDKRKGNVIAFFVSANATATETYFKVADFYRDFCQFHVAYGEALSEALQAPQPLPAVVYKPDVSHADANEAIYNDGLAHYEQLSAWTQQRCVPVVREITFQNAEELTEESLPMVMLFHRPERDMAAVRDFKLVVSQRFSDEQSNINFLIANGEVFTHPLEHMDRSVEDLPLIAIDSLKHMFLFPNFEDLYVPGVLEQFLADFYSEKLHTTYHQQRLGVSFEESFGYRRKRKSDNAPLDSIFRKLLPSGKRYTLLPRDEL